MSLVEIVVIQSQEGILILIAQCLIDRFVKYPDTRMIHICLTRVLDKEHVTDQSHQSVTNPQTALVMTIRKISGNLPLCRILLFQVVEVIRFPHQEMITHILGMDTKQAVYQAIVDERTCKELLAESQSEILYLSHRQR